MAASKADTRARGACAHSSEVRRWRGQAFGLELDAGFPARGLLDGRSSGHPRRTSLELLSSAALSAAWEPTRSSRLRELRSGDGRPLLTIDEHPELGYLLHAPAYGRYVVSGSGSEVLCAPARMARWRWQAFLVGQILPLAALLQGLEVLHASAVGLVGHTVALVGDSGAGKSSLAVNLMRLGASFLTDDVLALEADGGPVVGHPGAGLTSVRHAEAVSLGQRALDRLGTIVGRDEHELRVAVEPERRPLPVAAMYYIERSDRTPQAAVESIAPDPRLLLGSTFNGFVRAHERLTKQLDLCAEIARRVPTFRATVWPGLDARALAALIHAHAVDEIEAREPTAGGPR